MLDVDWSIATCLTQPYDTGLQGLNMGLFDRTTLGLTLQDAIVLVDARAVASFAKALGIVPATDGSVPPSYFTHIDAAADVVRRSRGEPTILERIRCDQRYLLHGEESYELLKPMRSGDRLTIKAHIADFYDSSKGHLEFAVVEQSATDEARGLILRARRVYIHQLPA
jgi:hypothetical protein